MGQCEPLLQNVLLNWPASSTAVVDLSGVKIKFIFLRCYLEINTDEILLY